MNLSPKILFTIASTILTLITPLPSQAQDDPMSQINDVRQFRDINPTDWAYQALTELITRYNCLAGYPNETFQGSRPLSRFEFAAGLNACLQQIERLLAENTTTLATKEDLETIRRLTQEFANEIAILRGKIDGLEARTTDLELSQFSTTTKLRGEAIFALSDVFGGESITNITRLPANANTNTVLQYRTRLSFDTSFYGSDLLRTRLAASNASPLLNAGGDTGGTNPANLLFANEARLALDTSNVQRNTNGLFLDQLSYNFAWNNQLRVNIFAAGGSHFHYANTVNPYLDTREGGSGGISRFAQRNPIYGIGGDASGIGLNYRLNEHLQLDLGYLANRANQAPDGLFDGNYSFLSQLVLLPGKKLQIGLTYLNAYSRPNLFRFGGSGTATGSFQANLIPLSLNANAGRSLNNAAFNTPVISNSYGLEIFYQFNPRLALSGWAGFTNARLINTGDAHLWNYALALNFPDLGREGNLGTILIGAEPSLKGIETGGRPVPVFDRSDSLHLETSYRYQISDQITLTPALIWLPAINQNRNNEDIFIFTLQTHFKF